MKVFLASLAALLWCGAAVAQQSPTPPPTVALPVDLVNRTMTFLNFGGTWNEAQGLREAILQAAQAAQKDAAAAAAPKPPAKTE